MDCFPPFSIALDTSSFFFIALCCLLLGPVNYAKGPAPDSGAGGGSSPGGSSPSGGSDSSGSSPGSSSSGGSDSGGGGGGGGGRGGPQLPRKASGKQKPWRAKVVAVVIVHRVHSPC